MGPRQVHCNQARLDQDSAHSPFSLSNIYYLQFPHRSGEVNDQCIEMVDPQPSPSVDSDIFERDSWCGGTIARSTCEGMVTEGSGDAVPGLLTWKSRWSDCMVERLNGGQEVDLTLHWQWECATGSMRLDPEEVERFAAADGFPEF